MTESHPKTKGQLIEDRIAAASERKDRLGKGMDAGIIETVALLNLFEFPTSGSCEGHIDHGLANPWVHITAMDEPEERFVGEREEKQRIALKYNLSADDIERSENEQADEEYYEWERTNDPPYTADRIAWHEKMQRLGQRVRALVDDFNRGRNDKEPLYMDAHGISVGKDEKASDVEDKAALEVRLRARRETLHAFNVFLRNRFLGTQ